MKMSFTHTDNVQVCGTAAADPVWSEAESFLFDELQRETADAEEDDQGGAPLTLAYSAMPENREKFSSALAKNIHRTLEDERMANAVSVLNTFRHLSDLVCAALDEHALDCLVRRGALTLSETVALKLVARRIVEKIEGSDSRAPHCEQD